MHLLQMRQGDGVLLNAAQQARPQVADPALQGEVVAQGVRQPVDLASHISAGLTGIARLDDGRHAFVCTRHQLARLPFVTDWWLLDDCTCRICDAEREAGESGERLRFREALRHA